MIWSRGDDSPRISSQGSLRGHLASVVLVRLYCICVHSQSMHPRADGKRRRHSNRSWSYVFHLCIRDGADDLYACEQDNKGVFERAILSKFRCLIVPRYLDNWQELRLGLNGPPFGYADFRTSHSILVREHRGAVH